MNREQRQKAKAELKSDAIRILNENGLKEQDFVSIYVVDGGDHLYIEVLRRDDVNYNYKLLEKAKEQFKKETRSALYFPNRPLPTYPL